MLFPRSVAKLRADRRHPHFEVASENRTTPTARIYRGGRWRRLGGGSQPDHARQHRRDEHTRRDAVARVVCHAAPPWKHRRTGPFLALDPTFRRRNHADHDSDLTSDDRQQHTMRSLRPRSLAARRVVLGSNRGTRYFSRNTRISRSARRGFTRSWGRKPRGLRLEKCEGKPIGFMREDARGSASGSGNSLKDREDSLDSPGLFDFANRRSPVQPDLWLDHREAGERGRGSTARRGRARGRARG
jgi:hypothetical protein